MKKSLGAKNILLIINNIKFTSTDYSQYWIHILVILYNKKSVTLI